MTTLETQGLAARHAARVLATAGTARKDAALEAIAAALEARSAWILEANARDMEAATLKNRLARLAMVNILMSPAPRRSPSTAILKPMRQKNHPMKTR